MPKKVHGRQAKQRPRGRRTTPSTQTAMPLVEGEQMSGSAVPVAQTTVSPAATVRPASARAASGPRAGAARRAPTVTMNYAYLRHDLLSLSVLGPAMIVLLIASYLVFHGA